IPKDVVRHLSAPQPRQDLQPPAMSDFRIATPALLPEHLHLVVVIIGRLGITIGDEDVLVPIIVVIAKERTPAPFRIGDARQAGDLTEDDLSVPSGPLVPL